MQAAGHSCRPAPPNRLSAAGLWSVGPLGARTVRRPLFGATVVMTAGPDQIGHRVDARGGGPVLCDARDVLADRAVGGLHAVGRRRHDKIEPLGSAQRLDRKDLLGVTDRHSKMKR